VPSSWVGRYSVLEDEDRGRQGQSRAAPATPSRPTRPRRAGKAAVRKQGQNLPNKTSRRRVATHSPWSQRILLYNERSCAARRCGPERVDSEKETAEKERRFGSSCWTNERRESKKWAWSEGEATTTTINHDGGGGANDWGGKEEGGGEGRSTGQGTERRGRGSFFSPSNATHWLTH